MRITIPTALTLFRILLLPVMVIVFYAPFKGANVAAAFIFIAAAITDWLDGFIARRWNMGSAFGEFLDPVADKLMVGVTLFLNCVQIERVGGRGGVEKTLSGVRRIPRRECRHRLECDD